MEKYGDLPINRQYSRYNETKNEYILSISKSQYSLSTTLLLNLLNIGGQEFIVFFSLYFFYNQGVDKLFYLFYNILVTRN